MTESGVERLRYAIIKQACTDFSRAYIGRKSIERKQFKRRTEKDLKALCMHRSREEECRAFFYSGWYATLCDIPPDKMIRALMVRRQQVTRKTEDYHDKN